MLTFGRLVGTFMARPYVALDATEAIASAAARGGRVVVALQGLGSVGGKGQGKGQGEGEGQGEDKGRGVLLQLEVATAPPFSAAPSLYNCPPRLCCRSANGRHLLPSMVRNMQSFHLFHCGSTNRKAR